MPEEVGIILDHLIEIKSIKYGDLELFSGQYKYNDSEKILISTAWSGWGKVSAARATTRLLTSKLYSDPVDFLLFTGVAGAVDKKLKQWDIILSHALIQHDMDARPFFDKYCIPALNSKKIFANKFILEKVFCYLSLKLSQKNLSKFGSVYKGLIATGDMFISEKVKINQLSKEIDDLIAVEMEGAAFAQVAQQENVDWIVMRVISDGADENAVQDFKVFLDKYKLISFNLIEYFLSSILQN